jgi:hypothetical protein
VPVLGARSARAVVLAIAAASFGSSAVAGCDGDVFPPTPRAGRLGLRQAPSTVTLEMHEERVLQGFLLPGALVERRGDGALRMLAWTDGRSTPRTSLRFERDGLPVPEGEAHGVSTWISVENRARGGTRLRAALDGMQARGRGPKGPAAEPPVDLELELPRRLWMAGDGDSVLLAWDAADAPAGLEWRLGEGPGLPFAAASIDLEPVGAVALRATGRRGLRLAGVLPGIPVSVRARWADGQESSWATATPGALPTATRERRIPLDPLACGDAAFPRQAAAGHVGCRGPEERGPDAEEQPLLDLFVADGSQKPRDLRGRPSTSPGGPPVELWPSKAATAAAPDDDLIWAGLSMGFWSPAGGPPAAPLPGARIRGRPAADATTLAFARADRLEAAPRGSNQRSQIPARPADVARPLAVAGGWLAVLEGPLGGNTLRVLDARRSRSAVMAGPSELRSLGAAGSWLAFFEDATLRLLPLLGGEAWRLPLRGGFASAPEGFDDWFVVESRAGGSVELLAVHAPTGIVTPLWAAAGEHVALRGANGGRLSAWVRAPGEPGELRAREAPQRVFEEDGIGIRGTPLRTRAGGHGGAHGWLPGSGERFLRFDPGPRGGRVELFRASAGAAGTIEVSVGAVILSRHEFISDAGSEKTIDNLGTWMQIAQLGGAGTAAAEDRVVTLRFQAGTGGMDVDAVRFVPDPARTP